MSYKFETLQIHVGQEQADPATDARAVPIYATSSYVFHNSDHAADRFGLRDAGNIYGRLTNPTQGVFEQRIAALEGGVAALAVASGAAAITYAIENIARAGDHIVAEKTLYGGTYNLLLHTLPEYGITTTFVEPNDLQAYENAIQENTKAIYAETLGNPNANLVDIHALAEIAHRHVFGKTSARREKYAQIDAVRRFGHRHLQPADSQPCRLPELRKTSQDQISQRVVRFLSPQSQIRADVGHGNLQRLRVRFQRADGFPLAHLRISDRFS